MDRSQCGVYKTNLFACALSKRTVFQRRNFNCVDIFQVFLSVFLGLLLSINQATAQNHCLECSYNARQGSTGADAFPACCGDYPPETGNPNVCGISGAADADWDGVRDIYESFIEDEDFDGIVDGLDYKKINIPFPAWSPLLLFGFVLSTAIFSFYGVRKYPRLTTYCLTFVGLTLGTTYFSDLATANRLASQLLYSFAIPLNSGLYQIEVDSGAAINPQYYNTWVEVDDGDGFESIPESFNRRQFSFEHTSDKSVVRVQHCSVLSNQLPIVIYEGQVLQSSDSTSSSFTTDYGSLRGDHTVNHDGTFAYSLDLVIPPGINGVQPQLSLDYSSAAKNGHYGWGWSLGGVSMIERCSATVEQDGGSGNTKSRDNEGKPYEFCLDGQRLVEVSPAEYRTEVESFKRITRFGSDLDPQGWTVLSVDGELSTYGMPGSSSAHPSKVDDAYFNGVAWYLSSVEDINQNQVIYHYEKVNYPGAQFEHRLKAIDYTKNPQQDQNRRVFFEYEGKVDARVDFRHGQRGRIASRVRAIYVYANTSASLVLQDNWDSVYRLYYQNKHDFGYDDPVNTSRLKRITRCFAGGGCTEPLEFEWQGVYSVSQGTEQDILNTIRGANYVDFNGDGMLDTMHTYGNGGACAPHAVSFDWATMKNTGLLPLLNHRWPCVWIRWGDERLTPRTNIAEWSKTLNDFTNGLVEPLFPTGVDSSNELVLEHGATTDSRPLPHNIGTLDFNGDGLSDIYISHTPRDGRSSGEMALSSHRLYVTLDIYLAQRVDRNAAMSEKFIEAPGYHLDNYARDGYIFRDVNGDSLVDAIRIDGRKVWVSLNNKGGFDEEYLWSDQVPDAARPYVFKERRSSYLYELEPDSFTFIDQYDGLTYWPTFDPNDLIPDPDHLWSEQNVPDLSSNSRASAGLATRLVDFNGDGLLDIDEVGSGQYGTTGSSPTIGGSTRRGDFSCGRQIDFDNVDDFLSYPHYERYWYYLCDDHSCDYMFSGADSADFNGDGNLEFFRQCRDGGVELIETSGRNKVVSNQNIGQLYRYEVKPNGWQTYAFRYFEGMVKPRDFFRLAPLVADFNADGLDDVMNPLTREVWFSDSENLIGPYAVFGDPDLFFQRYYLSTFGGEPYDRNYAAVTFTESPSVFDINGDGLPEIFDNVRDLLTWFHVTPGQCLSHRAEVWEDEGDDCEDGWGRHSGGGLGDFYNPDPEYPYPPVPTDNSKTINLKSLVEARLNAGQLPFGENPPLGFTNEIVNHTTEELRVTQFIKPTANRLGGHHLVAIRSGEHVIRPYLQPLTQGEFYSPSSRTTDNFSSENLGLATSGTSSPYSYTGLPVGAEDFTVNGKPAKGNVLFRPYAVKSLEIDDGVSGKRIINYQYKGWRAPVAEGFGTGSFQSRTELELIYDESGLEKGRQTLYEFYQYQHNEDVLEEKYSLSGRLKRKAVFIGDHGATEYCDATTTSNCFQKVSETRYQYKVRTYLDDIDPDFKSPHYFPYLYSRSTEKFDLDSGNLISTSRKGNFATSSHSCIPLSDADIGVGVTDFTPLHTTTDTDFHPDGVMLNQWELRCTEPVVGGAHVNLVTGSQTVNSLSSIVARGRVRGLVGETITSAFTGIDVNAALANADDRRTTRTFNSIGQLETETIGDSQAPDTELTTTYSYNSFGSTSGITESWVNNPDYGLASSSRTTVFTETYTSTGERSLQIINALGQSTAQTFEPVYGQVATSMDLNGLQTGYSYDVLGRLKTVVYPHGYSEEFSYHLCSPCANVPLAAARYVERTVVGGSSNLAAPGRVYTDEVGREVATRVARYNGSFAYTYQHYDRFGRVAAKADPHFSGDAVYLTQFSYDELDRIRESNYADGTMQIVDYNGYVKTITNREGQQSVRITNSAGWLLRSIDNNGTPVELSYYPFGELKATQVNNDTDTLVELQYDYLGRRTQLDDPNTGVIDYRYNPLGMLVGETDALGQVAQYQYDMLGRVIQRIDDLNAVVSSLPFTQRVHQWSYDIASNGVGLLATMNGYDTDGLPYSESFSYNSLSLPASTQISYQGRIDTISHVYDAYGRVSRQVYPAGLMVRSSYDDETGLVDSIYDHNSDELLWQLHSDDARGNITSYQLGGAIDVVRDYEPVDGRIAEIQALRGTTVLQDQRFEFSPLGNLEKRIDLRVNIGQRFCYDSMNRLLATLNGTAGSQGSCAGVAPDSTYDALGNVISNAYHSGAMLYGENGAGPNAITKAGAKSLYYNARGALYETVEGIDKQTIEYSALQDKLLA